MLVVPNRKASIYSQLPCSYEAFLAYMWEKEISSASMPCLKKVLVVWSFLLAIAVAGLATTGAKTVDPSILVPADEVYPFFALVFIISIDVSRGRKRIGN